MHDANTVTFEPVEPGEAFHRLAKDTEPRSDERYDVVIVGAGHTQPSI